MASAVYALCTATSALCAWLLLRQYVRSRTRLLFWSGVAFVGLALSNALVFTDFVVFPDVDLALLRSGVAFASVALLAFGLIWDGR
jgi:hypothetical protein